MVRPQSSKNGPTGGRVPETWVVEWDSIAADDPEVEAAIRKLDAEVDKISIEIGMYTETEARQHRNVDGKAGRVRVETADVLPMPGEVTAPAALGPDGQPLATGGGEDVQQLALNGAQIQALADLAVAVSMGEMAPEVALWLVEISVPGLGTQGAATAMAIAAKWGAERAVEPAQAPTPVALDHAVSFARAFGLDAVSARADTAFASALVFRLDAP